MRGLDVGKGVFQRDADRHPSLTGVLLRALLYALAITALVVFAPGADHVFIYQGF